MAHCRFAIVVAIALTVLACAAEAAPARLDARTRAALASLRAGTRSISDLRARGLAVGPAGELDVVIRGSVAPGAQSRFDIRG